ncbi:NAD-dependent DNA ligase LigA [Candidatus Parcubacteria bacterium]|nr:NAD-dependent DNA ligase LigA [Candidatus Parcubacteria bacterium]
MNKQEAENRIEKLKKEINHHRYLYHVLDKQEISEGALDSLKNELFKLEQEYPEFITADSPTQRVEGKPLDKFGKVAHEPPMLSLFDAFSAQDMADWEGRAKKIIKSKFNLDYYCELKFDGLAMSLRYENGIFTKGATRGNGKVGEDVTNNLKTIESIPLRLRIPSQSEFKKNGFDLAQTSKILKAVENGEIIIRGEALMTKKVFNELNKKYEKAGKKVLANPRNGAAGSIRQLDSKITAERKLDFYVYGIAGADDLQLQAHEQEIKLAKLLGLKTLENNKYCRNLDEVNEFHKYWEENREKLLMEVDGVVVKVNNLALWPVLGIVGKGPRYAMAYKFAAEQVTTILKSAVWQIGRTGTLTPIGVLEPVRVGGVTVSHVTLHNIDEIERLDLKINDTIIIERAGDVIPKVAQVLPKMRSGIEQKILIPKNCPICGSRVERIPGEVALRCTNKDCYAVILRRLSHWTSKAAIDIEGLGPKVVEQLVKAGLVSDIADFYALREYDLKPLERFADKSAENLIKAIAAKKEVELPRFIYGLGIRHVGEETALRISDFTRQASTSGFQVSDFKNGMDDVIQTFQNIKQKAWEEMYDFGPVMAKSIYDWWHDGKNIELLEKLKKNGITIKQQAGSNTQHSEFIGKIFVLTGTLSGLTRNEAKAKIRGLGGKISATVSKNTDFVVAGENPGSKFEKAKNLGVEVINEREFSKMI